jgi:hypothetical protein
MGRGEPEPSESTVARASGLNLKVSASLTGTHSTAGGTPSRRLVAAVVTLLQAFLIACGPGAPTVEGTQLEVAGLESLASAVW